MQTSRPRARLEIQSSDAVEDQVRELAQGFDALTEDQFHLLCAITPATAESWRRTGRGPRWLRIGNRVLYPRQGVAEFLESQVREPAASTVRRSL